MDALNRRALLSLDFVIVGGSIAGLAAAYRLCKAGHKVRVLERASGPVRRAGGVRLPPNLTNILYEWGLGDKIAQQAQRTCGSECISLDTGEVVGRLLWLEEIMTEIGAEFLLMHYADLHSILHAAALAAGAHISYNATVVSVLANPPRVRLANGEELQADMVIGADGPHSLVRDAIEGERENNVSDRSSLSTYLATIPREQLKKEPDLEAFTNAELGGPQVWRMLLIFNWQRGGSEYAVIAFWPDDETDTTEDGWDISIPRKKFVVDGDSRHRILDLSPNLFRIRYVDRESPSEWTDESGRLLLIGEAAHPSFPCNTQGCSLQVEDAEVLGSLFSRLHSWDQLPYFTEAFQEIRQPRCHTVHSKEKMGFQLVRLPPGPDRDARDEVFRAMMHSGLQGWDEGKIRWQWEELGEVFGYNAREAAEDWWVQWGMLRERSQKQGAPGIPIPIEVTEVKIAQDDPGHEQ
ncbi:FAD/NAD(P)-binding domain-containing protein [Leucogyrophana mollusca]|uniref:FAD/NAD(P)-binding domain-containing protein n=1 Tax=Leucogyrophana mollusca TaxID=85980 RepID=A0ACB8BQC6_9AGAM|nr:FAD/NAD(P)-binding domain-containing protein [Leucogyrophana mollusca]